MATRSLGAPLAGIVLVAIHALALIVAATCELQRHSLRGFLVQTAWLDAQFALVCVWGVLGTPAFRWRIAACAGVAAALVLVEWWPNRTGILGSSLLTICALDGNVALVILAVLLGVRASGYCVDVPDSETEVAAPTRIQFSLRSLLVWQAVAALAIATGLMCIRHGQYSFLLHSTDVRWFLAKRCVSALADIAAVWLVLGCFRLRVRLAALAVMALSACGAWYAMIAAPPYSLSWAPPGSILVEESGFFVLARVAVSMGTLFWLRACGYRLVWRPRQAQGRRNVTGIPSVGKLRRGV